MPKVLVPLAQGCEELEAVTIIDILRRAGIEVVSAGLDSQPVRASRGTLLIPDTTLDAALKQTFECKNRRCCSAYPASQWLQDREPNNIGAHQSRGTDRAAQGLRL